MSLDPMNPEAGSADKQDNPVVAYCRVCGKRLVQQAVINYQGTVYCSGHVPQSSSASNPYTAPPPSALSSVSPGLAFVLGLIPGVGAIYNGQYAKGFVHVLVTGVVFSLADRGSGLDAFAPMLVFAWFFYMAFEAYHTCRKRMLGEPVDEFSSILPRSEAQNAIPLAPLLLIGLGVVLLLHQLELIDLYRIRRYVTPMVLIGAGVFMLYGRLKGSSSPRPPEPAASEEMFHERS